MASTRNVNPVLARNRATKAALARTGTDYHLRKLADAAETLTGEQKRQLAAVLSAAGQPSRLQAADYHLSRLATMPLTTGQRRQLARLLLPWLADDGEAA